MIVPDEWVERERKSGYYLRPVLVHEDGTLKRHTRYDREREDVLRAALALAWGVEVHFFADLHFLDVWLERQGRVYGYGEFKWREFASYERKSVWLGVRKWFHMYMMWVTTGRPVWLFVRFTDGLFFIPVSKMDPRNHRIVEARRQKQSRNDREPVVVIPIAWMEEVGG